MTVGELLQWQWSDYAAKHHDRVNLAIHLFAVPLFMIGCVLVVLAALEGLAFVVAGIVAVVVAIGLEGLGHRREAEPPAPFTGVLGFARRFFLEQWVTFPRYVLSGGCLRALGDAGATRTPHGP